MSTQITYFNAISGISMCLTALVLGSVLGSSTVKRSKSWINLFIGGVGYSIALFLIVGRQTGSQPPFGLCFFQAILIYAWPVQLACAFACLVIEFYMQLMDALYHIVIPEFLHTFLFVVPWAFFVFNFILSMMVVSDPSGVQRDAASNAYCNVASTQIPSYTTGAVVVICALIGLIYEVKVGLMLRRNWTGFRYACLTNPMISWSLYLRICTYHIAVLIAQGLGIFVLTSDAKSNNESSWRMLLPLIPFCAAAAFGTQKDIMRVFMFWKWRKVRETLTTSMVESTAPVVEIHQTSSQTDSSFRRERFVTVSSA